MQLIRQSPAAIDYEVYDEILKCQHANMIPKYLHKMSNSEKKVYYFLKKVYSFFHVFRIPYIAVKLMLVLDVGYHSGLKFHISFRYFQTKNSLEKLNDLHH